MNRFINYYKKIFSQEYMDRTISGGVKSQLTLLLVTIATVLPWIEAVKEIAPRQVMIYTIDRETPDHDLQKATHEELDRIVALLEKEGIPATASY